MSDFDYDLFEEEQSKPTPKIDLTQLYFYQMHDCQLAFNSDNLMQIVTTVGTFERMLSGQKDNDFVEEKKKIIASKEMFFKKIKGSVVVTDSTDHEALIGDITNKWFKYYYGEIFEAIVRLCVRLGYFGYRNVAAALVGKRAEKKKKR